MLLNASPSQATINFAPQFDLSIDFREQDPLFGTRYVFTREAVICAKCKRDNIDAFEEFDNETCRLVRPDAEDGPASRAYLGDRPVSISRKTNA